MPVSYWISYRSRGWWIFKVTDCFVESEFGRLGPMDFHEAQKVLSFLRKQ